MPNPRVDAQRLWDDLMTLADILDEGAPPHTRLAFGPAYARARDWLTGRFEDAGLAVRRDAAGSLIGARPGRRDLPPLAVGSHVDTVDGGGRFDGPLGVLAALELARSLADAGETLEHPLEIVDFTAEEPNPYGSSCVGSRAWAGTLDTRLLALENADGEPLATALVRAGGDPGRVHEAHRPAGVLAAYVELHIEQGPILERDGLDAGVVTGIVAIRRLLISLAGKASHSGTTPIDVRRDALPAAAEVVLATERESRAAPGELLATVGWLRVEPNAPNIVPGRVELVVEARSLDPARRDAALDAIAATARAAGEARRLDVDVRHLSEVPAVVCDPRIVAALEAGCAEVGATSRRLTSGAGHDASQVSHVAPVGMLFAPSRDGLSHHADEWTSPEQCALAADALLAGVRALDRALA
ncbi:MAG: M20 family metallo-hydrolase [Thermoleophilia bacterium]